MMLVMYEKGRKKEKILIPPLDWRYVNNCLKKKGGQKNSLAYAGSYGALRTEKCSGQVLLRNKKVFPRWKEVGISFFYRVVVISRRLSIVYLFRTLGRVEWRRPGQHHSTLFCACLCDDEGPSINHGTRHLFLSFFLLSVGPPRFFRSVDDVHRWKRWRRIRPLSTWHVYYRTRDP